MEKEPLFAPERHKAILARLEAEQKVLVHQLCKEFSVSPATIRNDLNELEAQGLLRRTHGGAIPLSRTGLELTTEQKAVRRMEEKRAIAACAATMVENGETLAIDTGTTTLELARCLLERTGLTVVTNDMKIASLFEEQSDASILFIGGLVRRGFHCTTGPMAVQGMAELRVDRCFMATNGLTVRSGMTTPDIGHAQVKRQLLHMGSQVVLLCDSEKIGRDSFAVVDGLESIDVLITDERLRPELRAELEEAGLDIRIAGKEEP